VVRVPSTSSPAVLVKFRPIVVAVPAVAAAAGRIAIPPPRAWPAEAPIARLLAKDKANTLFGSGSDEVQAALRDLSTKAGFARLDPSISLAGSTPR
jgi:hypothetical protein